MTNRAKRNVQIGLDDLRHDIRHEDLRADVRRLRNFADAQRIVEGAFALVPELGILEARVNGTRGPQPEVTMRALLVARIAMALEGRREYTVQALADYLDGCPDRILTELGFKHRRHGERRVTKRILDKRLARLIDQTSGAEFASGRRAHIDENGERTTTFRGEAEAQQRQLGRQGLRRMHAQNHPFSAEDRAERGRLGYFLANALLVASVDAAVCDHRLTHDWTDLEAYANTYRRDRTADRIVLASADTEAAWGRRAPKDGGTVVTHPPPRTNQIDGLIQSEEWEPFKNELYFGHMVFASATTIAGTDKPLMVGIDTRPANEHPYSEHYPTRTRQFLTSAGISFTHELVDRGFSQYDGVHNDARRDRVHLVFDVREDQLGIRGSIDGAPIGNGMVMCPEIANRPKLAALLKDTPPAAKLNEHQRRERWATISENQAKLQPFTWVAQGDVGPDLRVTVTCPARAGRMRCPHVPASMSLPYDTEQVYDPPTDRNGQPLTCCSKGQLTIDSDHGTKIRQQHPLYSRDWRDVYSARLVIERMFNILKNNRRCEGRTLHALGLASRELTLAIVGAACNIKQIREYAHEHHDDYDAPTLAPAREYHPHRNQPAKRLAAA